MSRRPLAVGLVDIGVLFRVQRSVLLSGKDCLTRKMQKKCSLENCSLDVVC